VIAEGRNTLAVEDAVNADFQLFFTRKPLGGNEF
jgi:hypothetical protein